MSKNKLINSNKLVRDNIPEIIFKNGGTINIKKLVSDMDYYNALVKKMHEEVDEMAKIPFNKSDTADTTPLYEELADILEVYYAILKFHNIAFEDIQNVAEKKRKTNGGFEGRIFLNSYEKVETEK